jgi:hypothetical protein
MKNTQEHKGGEMNKKVQTIETKFEQVRVEVAKALFEGSLSRGEFLHHLHLYPSLGVGCQGLRTKHGRPSRVP